MSPTTEIGRQHQALPAAQPPKHPQGRSRTHRRAVRALGATFLMATAAAGCTAPPPRPAESPETESAPSAAAVVRLLEDQPKDTPLDAGRYAVSSIQAPGPMAPVLNVPQGGYTSIDGGAGVMADWGDYRFMWLQNIRSVYAHPCDVDPTPVGTSVADLANALVAQPLRDGTDPVPVTVGGYDGLYVEISVPEDFDLSTCRDGYFYSWPGRGEKSPGQVDLLWILDVEGQRMTFDLSYSPRSAPEEVEELKKVVTTATFMPRDGA